MIYSLLQNIYEMRKLFVFVFVFLTEALLRITVSASVDRNSYLVISQRMGRKKNKVMKSNETKNGFGIVFNRIEKGPDEIAHLSK